MPITPRKPDIDAGNMHREQIIATCSRIASELLREGETTIKTGTLESAAFLAAVRIVSERG